jgi:hypothetical protein
VSAFGPKCSQRRKDWWNKVIKPVSSMSKQLPGKPGRDYFTSYKNWKKATGSRVFVGGRVLILRHPKE